MTDKVLILDFGSQVTQLIARRLRESRRLLRDLPVQRRRRSASRPSRRRAIILSGGPATVTEQRHAARAADRSSSWACRCSASATASRRWCAQLGGKVEGSRPPRVRPRLHRRHRTTARCSRASGRTGAREQVWMSHGDRVTALPPGFRVRRRSARARPSPSSPTTSAASTARMFHPEVVHTPHGGALLRELHPRRRRLPRRLDHGGVPRQAIERIRAQVGQGPGDLRPVGRRRFLGRRGADPRGDRRPAHLHLRRPRPAARRARRRRWSRLFRDHYNIPLVHRDAARRCSSASSPASTDPEQQAQDHRRHLHRRVRGGGEEDRRRRFPGPGHALSRRDRERLVHRRPERHHQVAPQCRRPARAHAHEAGRAAARAVQGRGARARPRARPARGIGRPPSVPGPGPRHPHPRRRSRARSSTSCARPTRSISRRSATPASTTRSGRPSPCCCRCAPSA